MFHSFILKNKNVIIFILAFIVTLSNSFADNSINNKVENKKNITPKILISSSILPIYSIVGMAIDDIAAFQNQLIILPNVDEHEAQLSLQDVAKMKKSDVIFITTSELEKHIIIDAKKHNYYNNVVALGDSPNIVRYNMDDSFLEHLEHLEHKGNHKDYIHAHTEEAELDPHLWLSVNNAKVMLINVVDKLISLNPKVKTKLENNKAKYLKLLTELNNYVINQLKDNEKRVISYHNAWKYYASDFNIHYMGSITSEQDEHSHGAFSPKALSNLINAIKEQNIKCVFNEEQFQDPILSTISNKTGIKILPLNPMGVLNSKTNPADIYFDMIKYNTKQFKSC